MRIIIDKTYVSKLKYSQGKIIEEKYKPQR